MKTTHFAENRITLPPVGHVWWVLKGHIKGQKATNCSTCAILFQRIRNVPVTVKSEAVSSCFVTYKYNNNNNNNNEKIYIARP